MQSDQVACDAAAGRDGSLRLLDRFNGADDIKSRAYALLADWGGSFLPGTPRCFASIDRPALAEAYGRVAAPLAVGNSMRGYVAP